MPESRWDRLAADLRDAGFEPRLDERPYSETYRGRPRHGVSRSITFMIPGLGTVTVSDKWWSKNPDTWLGWTVCAEDREGITIGQPSWGNKNRSATVHEVREAFKRLGAPLPA